MEIRHRRMVKTARLILAAVVVAIAVMWSGSAAWADDEDAQSGQYEVDGIGSLITVPDLKDSDEPTLFETYPVWAYQWDYVDKSGVTQVVDNTVDRNINTLANSTFMQAQSWTLAAIAMSWQTMSFDSYTALGTQLTGSIGSVSNAFVQWLLPSTLAIGALVAWVRGSSSPSQLATQLGCCLAAGVVAISLANTPEQYVNGLNAFRDAGTQTAAAAAVGASEGLTEPIEVAAPTFTGTEQNNAMRQMGDAIWRTFVVTPWCQGEFGSIEGCKKHGETVLSKPLFSSDAETRSAYLESAAFKSSVGEDSEAYATITGHNAPIRLVTAITALIAAFVFAVMVLVLNCLVAFNLMLALMMLVVGGLFACLWAIPGAPRQWANNWLTLLFNFTVMSFLVQLVLTIVLAVAMAAMRLTSSMGWFTSLILTITAMIAALVLLAHLKRIFQASDTGLASKARGLFGAAFAVRYLLRGLGRKRKRPRAPKQPRDKTQGATLPDAPDGGIVRPRGMGGANKPRRLGPAPTGGTTGATVAPAPEHTTEQAAPEHTPRGRYTRASGEVPKEAKAPTERQKKPTGAPTAPSRTAPTTPAPERDSRLGHVDPTAMRPQNTGRTLPPRTYQMPRTGNAGRPESARPAPRVGSGVGNAHLRRNAPRRRTIDVTAKRGARA